MSCTEEIIMTNELTVQRDSIDEAAAGRSPIRGTHLKFNNTWSRGFEGEAANVKQGYLVTEFDELWQFIKKECPVEYVLREPGSKTRPSRPDTHTDKAT
jgi:hypothetical protein